MSKFDLVEKIKLFDLISSLIKRNKTTPFFLLKKELSIKDKWQENYFNWGRNVLYYFFKSLEFKTITFPAFTCPTIVEPVEKAGKKVILSEIDLNIFNLDINKIPKKTECLVVVHTFGSPLEITLIKKRLPNIYIIEDCAHALFSKINDRFVGSEGDAVLFSLYKQIANINGALLLTKKKLIKNQYQEPNFKYLRRLIIKTGGWHQWLLDFKRCQYLPSIEPQELNNKMPSNLVFSLFEKGFRKLEKEIEGRRKIAGWYYQEAKESKFIIPQKLEHNSQSSCYHFVIRLKPELAVIREKVVLELRKRSIFIDRLWYKAPIIQKKYKAYQKKCPNALLLAKTVINLPIYSWYTKRDVEHLFGQMNKAIALEIRNS